MCPAATSFNFVRAVEKEVLLFNDLRYGENGKGDKDFLPWQDLLNLLDGSKLNVAMPKNHFASDMEWVKKQPIFATSEKKIVRAVSGRLDAGETSQMDERWTYIELKHSYDKDQINYNLIPCSRCFAELILTA